MKERNRYGKARSCLLSSARPVRVLRAVPPLFAAVPGAPGIFLRLVHHRLYLRRTGGLYLGRGRISCGGAAAREVLALLREYGISGRLTFSNSLLRAEHLADPQCNALCEQFAKSGNVPNGVIVHSDLLADYLRQRWPELYLVSSTTKVLTEFAELRQELEKPQFRYVVPDFRLNPALEQLRTLPPEQKAKIEFLCNECCWFGCTERKRCYETVSRQNLGENCPDHRCTAPDAAEGYRFSKAMRSPGFIGVEDIRQRYLPAGFSQFKIEGRGLAAHWCWNFCFTI